MFDSQSELADYLIKRSFLNSKILKESFTKINRIDFIPKEHSLLAYGDFPIPIGFEQTISQPSTVAFMLNLLDITLGQKILDIGSGSGWTTALIAQSIGSKGKVWAVERISELIDFSRQNLAGYNFKNISIQKAGKEMGLPDKAPFNRILVSARADKLPEELIKQLKINGIMIIPIKNSIWKITKTGEFEIMEQKFPGFSFVPLL